MKLRQALLLILLAILPTVLSAQYYDTGQDPASFRWLQIKTGKFRIIYPETYGSAGIDFARSLDDAYSRLTTFFPEKKFNIPVIIHNHTTQSNGYVAWAPRRMEIYPTPEQNSLPLDNNTQLAIHELTHVLQMESLNKGFSGFMSVFLGEQFPGAITALLPLWYLEGKAVLTETALTASGRGRSAAFQKQLKAISLEKGEMYKYDKLVNGSFRHFVPDYYQSGSQAVTWAYLKYDPAIWNRVLRTTANIPFMLDPVNISLLSSARLTKKRLYSETFDTLRSIWTGEERNNNPVSYEILNPHKKREYTSYHSPVLTINGNIAAIKTTLYDPPKFVLIDPDNGTERSLHTPGRIYPYFISSGQSYLAWVETRIDPRWENRNYSVIKLMDVRNRRIRQLSRRSRYMSAAISPDTRIIAASENSPDNINSLVLIDVITEQPVASIPSPENVYLQRLQWSDDGRKITMIFLSEEGEGILLFNNAERTWEILIGAAPVDYQSSFLRNDSLFFVSSLSGTENIYVRTPVGEITTLTNSRFGAIDPVLSGSRLIFSDYSSGGNSICQTELPPPGGRALSTGTSSFLVDRLDLPSQPSVIRSREDYTPVRYRKWLHPIRFHSWMPFYADLDEIRSDPRNVSPGFTLMSQNHLSTVVTTLGYEYSDKRHQVHSQLTWKGWYPVIDTRLDYGDEPQIYKLGENVNDPAIIVPEISITSRIYFPLRFTAGRFSQLIQPSASINYRNNYIYFRENDLFDYGQTQFSARFYFSNYHRYAIRDIYPRSAQVVDFNFSFYPFDTDIYGPFITFRSALYFPGILRNNGIKVRYEADKQVVEKLTLWNRIEHPRGYKNIASEELHLFSADYVAPLLYPDFNIGSLFYLTRVRADLFFDYARGTRNYYFRVGESGLVFDRFVDNTEIFKSYGIEMMADFFVFRLPFMVSAGTRAAWKNLKEFPTLEYLFTIDIYGMNIGKKRP